MKLCDGGWHTPILQNNPCIPKQLGYSKRMKAKPPSSTRCVGCGNEYETSEPCGKAADKHRAEFEAMRKALAPFADMRTYGERGRFLDSRTSEERHFDTCVQLARLVVAKIEGTDPKARDGIAGGGPKHLDELRKACPGCGSILHIHKVGCPLVKKK